MPTMPVSRTRKNPGPFRTGARPPLTQPGRGAASASAAQMALRRGYGAPGSGGDGRWDCRRRCRPWPILSDLSQVALARTAEADRPRASPARVDMRGKSKTGGKLPACADHRQAVRQRKLLKTFNLLCVAIELSGQIQDLTTCPDRRIRHRMGVHTERGLDVPTAVQRRNACTAFGRRTQRIALISSMIGAPQYIVLIRRCVPFQVVPKMRSMAAVGSSLI